MIKIIKTSQNLSWIHDRFWRFWNFFVKNRRKSDKSKNPRRRSCSSWCKGPIPALKLSILGAFEKVVVEIKKSSKPVMNSWQVSTKMEKFCSKTTKSQYFDRFLVLRPSLFAISRSWNMQNITYYRPQWLILIEKLKILKTCQESMTGFNKNKYFRL